MVRFKNFECTVDVDGVALPEYTDPDDAGEREGPVPTAIVYIQAEEGKPFSVTFSVVKGAGLFGEANAVVWSLILDGNEIKPGWLCKSIRKSCSIDCNKYRDRYGNWFQRDFLFSKLDIREDGPAHKDINTSSLGEIAISIRRYKIMGSTFLITHPNREEFADIRAVTSLPEKQLKGRDVLHSVGMSTPKPAIDPPTTTPGLFVDESPYAVIKFRYRTERALKGLGLIPRTPLPSLSPEPGAPEANGVAAEEMTREELLAEVRRLRSIRPPKVKLENAPAVKRERSVTVGPSGPVPKKQKQQKVIDLTGDSD